MFICMIKGDEFCPDLWIMPEGSTRVCTSVSMCVYAWTLGVLFEIWKHCLGFMRFDFLSTFIPFIFNQTTLVSISPVPLLYDTFLLSWFLVNIVNWRRSFFSCSSFPSPPEWEGGRCGLPALYCPLLEGPGSWSPHTDTCPSHSQCRQTHSLWPCTSVRTQTTKNCYLTLLLLTYLIKLKNYRHHFVKGLSEGNVTLQETRVYVCINRKWQENRVCKTFIVFWLPNSQVSCIFVHTAVLF